MHHLYTVFAVEESVGKHHITVCSLDRWTCPSKSGQRRGQFCSIALEAHDGFEVLPVYRFLRRLLQLLALCLFSFPFVACIYVSVCVAVSFVRVFASHPNASQDPSMISVQIKEERPRLGSLRLQVLSSIET